MSLFEFAVWEAYLTSMGTGLSQAGFGSIIGWFYSVQGIVFIFMPALMGIVADRWIPAQRLLGLCHLLAGAFMLGEGFHGDSRFGFQFRGGSCLLYRLLAFFHDFPVDKSFPQVVQLDGEGKDFSFVCLERGSVFVCLDLFLGSFYAAVVG